MTKKLLQHIVFGTSVLLAQLSFAQTTPETPATPPPPPPALVVAPMAPPADTTKPANNGVIYQLSGGYAMLSGPSEVTTLYKSGYNIGFSIQGSIGSKGLYIKLAADYTEIMLDKSALNSAIGTTDAETGFSRTDNARLISFAPMLGYNIMTGSNFQPYINAGALILVPANKIESYNQHDNGTTLTTQYNYYNRSSGLGVVGGLGARYFFKNNFGIGVEGNYMAELTKQATFLSRKTVIIDGPGGINVLPTRTESVVTTNPISAFNAKLTVSYRF